MSNPIIVGVAQLTQPKRVTERIHPLKLIEIACQMALDDANSPKIVEYIDSIFMVNIRSWSYEDAPAELGEALGIKPVHKVYLPDGGDTPQMLANRAANSISSGKTKAVLITGGEALYSIFNAEKGKFSLDWPKKEKPSYMEGEIWDGTVPFENKYKIKFPPFSYSMLETAVRAAANRSIKEHNHYMGKLMEKFSRVASKNPYAWTQNSYSAEEIITPTPNNRYICHPYTKLMCSNVFVDQSAALIMTSETVAEEVQIAREKWVYLRGSADFKNLHKISKRPRLYDSPAAREGSRQALKQAGITLKDINAFDIYSCFPSIVEIITREIGVKENDPRDLTITGGLPYFGGPWSNYSMHSIVSAVDLIRKNPSFNIMIVANGGYNTKQSFGIYGNKPPDQSWGERDDSALQDKIYADSLPDPIEKASGKLKIDAYTIYHDRIGNPKRGIVVGTLENRTRTFAFIEAKADILLELEKQELVGQTFPVQYNIELERNILEIK
jgi:acetyl-CoA C-acetyltransferase